MTFNLSRFSTGEFTADFLDANGVITVPTSATLTITYKTTGLVTGSTVIAMNPAGQSFVANWGAGVSDLGPASYSISAPGQVTPTTGTLRILSSKA